MKKKYNAEFFDTPEKRERWFEEQRALPEEERDPAANEVIKRLEEKLNGTQ